MWLKIILTVVLIPILLLVYTVFKQYRRQKYFQNQGVKYSSEGFFETMQNDLPKIFKMIEATPTTFNMNTLVREYLWPNQKIPDIIAINMFAFQYLSFTSPKALQQVFVEKNKYHTKPWQERARWSAYLGRSLIFQKSEEASFKKRRASLASGFFKSKTDYIVEVAKRNTINILHEHKDKSEIDLEAFLSELQGRIIVNMMMGDGSEKLKVEYELVDGTITQQQFGVNAASLLRDNIEKLMQPKAFFSDQFEKVDITSIDKRLRRNCDRLSACIIKLIEDRRAGKIKGWKPDDSDILSVLMRNEHYTDNHLIAQECSVMFAAGSKTVQISTGNLIMYLNNYPDVAKKLQAEIDRIVEPVSDNPQEKLTFEVAEDFEYLRYCFNESLRIECPVSLTFFQSFSHDVEILGVNIPKDELWVVMPDVTHHDPEQWQKPDEFIPERFDPESQYFKKPDGAARHPWAFTPFIGGSRVCLGKNFADIMVRFTISTLLYYNKFEFVNPEYAREKPKFGVSATKPLNVMMKKLERHPLPPLPKEK